nr:hypothetical protein [Tanacetum cinerariifolium]
MLVAPKPKEVLIVYLSASRRAISAVLINERDTVLTPVYFVSHALQGPERNYIPMEKLVLVLVFVAKRAIIKMERHAGRTQYHVSAKDICERIDPSGFSCREAGQSSTRYVSGVDLILTSPKGTKFTYALRFQFTASNNEAEYEALIAGLRIAAQIGVCNVYVSVDSKLMANQVLGTYVAKEENMIKYLEKAKGLVSGFANFSISQVPRSLVEILEEKSIQEKEVATIVEEDGPTWMTLIMGYLKDGTLPYDRKEASKLRIKARLYELLEGVLYRRWFLKPWLRTTVYGGQSLAVEILLANHASGCTGYDTKILKNAGATYQRLVDKAFDSQVGRNIEVYIDDLVIKSHTEIEMLRNIDETF